MLILWNVYSLSVFLFVCLFVVFVFLGLLPFLAERQKRCHKNIAYDFIKYLMSKSGVFTNHAVSYF